MRNMVYYVYNIIFCISSAGDVPFAKNEPQDCIRGPGTQIRVGDVVRNVRWPAAVWQTGGCRFPCICWSQARIVAGLSVTHIATIVRSVRLAPIARQATRVGRDGHGTSVRWRRRRRHRVCAVGRNPRGFTARGRGHHQKTFARGRGRSVLMH